MSGSVFMVTGAPWPNDHSRTWTPGCGVKNMVTWSGPAETTYVQFYEPFSDRSDSKGTSKYFKI